MKNSHALFYSLSLMLPAVGMKSATAAPAGFVNEIHTTGLTQPTQLLVVPDGRILVSQKEGKILVIPAGGRQPLAAPFLDLTNVETFAGAGLLGFTLDPDFSANGHYYVHYVSASPKRIKVSRFTAAGNHTPPNTETVLWQDTRDSLIDHHGGGIVVGNDGKLYITTGDNLSPEDSQKLTTFRGKVLRINLDGSAPSDNPFADGPGGNLDEIWAFGLRNPFRMSVDRPTGRIFVADVGASDRNTSVEKIIVLARGANYGWPTCEEFCGPNVTPPLFLYRHLGKEASVTGGFVYRGTSFPGEYAGSYFYADYARRTMSRLAFGSGGDLAGSIPFEPADGSMLAPNGDIVDLRQGLDGSLLYLEFGFGVAGRGTIRQIRNTSVNQPPVAKISASPQSGSVPLTVSFSSAGSSDPEGDRLTYRWEFGDGGTSTDAHPNHTYQKSGIYTARLTISDGANSTPSDPISITAGASPTAIIATPAHNTLFRAGDVIGWSGSGSDPVEGDLPASALSWTVNFRHDNHIHPVVANASGKTGQLTIPTTGHDFSGSTSYEITLTVTNSHGLKDSKTVSILPKKTSLSFATTPPGLQIHLDGIARTTPYVHDTVEGFNHIIEAPGQVAGGTLHTFQSWSDGGAQKHAIIVPAAPRAYEAIFAGGQAVASPSLITGWTPGTLVTGGIASYWLGMKFTVGPQPLIVSELGRLMLSGNSETHVMKLVDGATGLDLPGGSVSVSMAGGTVGEFRYAALGGEITLAPNSTYYLVGFEIEGRDRFYGHDLKVTSTDAARVDGCVYKTEVSHWAMIGTTGNSYGPYTFRYRVGAPPPDTTPPAISNAAATAVTGTSASISWTTDEPSDSQVEYGLTAAYGLFSALDPTPATSRSVTLSGLTPGTTYHYRVVSRDKAGNLAASPGFQFTTAAPEPPPPAPETAFLTAWTPRTLITGGIASYWAGFRFTVGSRALTLTEVGRMMLPGNAQTHTVKLVNAATGADVPGGTASVSMAGGIAGEFRYAPLAAPIRLPPNTSYYLVSIEIEGRDHFYDWNAEATSTGDAIIQSGVNGIDGWWNMLGGPGNTYGPLNFRYRADGP